MKTLLTAVAALGLLTSHLLGQADQVKRRAKEVVNQSNVRQGIPAPAAPQPLATPTTAKPAAANPAAVQQSIARIQADIAGIKPGAPVTAGQKQQLIKDIAVACRGAKPSLGTVTAFVNDLAEALADKTLDAAKQSRLAQDVETVLNSGNLPATQFDAIIADVQAILQVSGAKRNLAASAAGKLKTVGLEVRRGAAR